MTDNVGKSSVSEAFVLAAGLGTRMKPITNTMPKPLIKVAGATMLDHALDALVKAGTGHAVINVHYLADQIEAHLIERKQPAVTISDERGRLLDSGGGVKKGLDHFSTDSIFVLNADSFWMDSDESNLSKLTSSWDPKQMDILMLLAQREEAVGFSGPGDFFQSDSGRLIRRGAAETAPFAYAGALIIKRSLFDEVEDDAFSLNRLFDIALVRETLFGQLLDGLWLHVGTPDAIVEAEQAIAGKSAA